MGFRSKRVAPAMQVTQPTPSDPADPAEGAFRCRGFLYCQLKRVAMFEGKIPWSYHTQTKAFFFKGEIPQVLSFVYFVLLDSPKMGKFNDPLYQYNLKWPYMHAFRVVVNGSKDTPIWHWRLPIHTLQPNTTPSFLCLWNLTCLDAQSFNLYSTFSFPTFDVWWDFQSFGWRRPVWPETLRNWQPRPSGRRWWLRRQRGRARCKWQHG